MLARTHRIYRSTYAHARKHARTHARTYARTRRKRAKPLEGSPVCIYLAFPQFCALDISATPRGLAPAFADGSHRELQKIRDREASRVVSAYHHGAYLARGRHVPGSGVAASCAHTKSRTRPTLQRQRVYSEEDRRPEQSASCRRCRLMAVLFYIRSAYIALCIGARDKNRFARASKSLSSRDVCDVCQSCKSTVYRYLKHFNFLSSFGNRKFRVCFCTRELHIPA